MANTNICFYEYSITVTYHDWDDESQPGYVDMPYFKKRRLTFGPDADRNDANFDFMNEKCHPADIARVYRSLRIQFPQAYHEFLETQQLRLWRRYRPHAPYARRYLHELRAHRHTSRNH